MAISQVKKLKLIFHKDDTKEIMSFLHKEGAVELKVVDGKSLGPDLDKIKEELSKDDARQLNVRVSRIERVIDFLEKFENKKFKLDFSGKEIIEHTKKDILDTYDWETDCGKIISYINKLEELEVEKKSINNDLEETFYWKDITVNLDSLLGTKWSRSIAGTLKPDDFYAFVDEVAHKPVEIIKVKESKQDIYFIAFVYSEDLAVLKNKITEKGKIIHWPNLSLSPKEIYLRLRRQKKIVNYRESKICREIKGLLHILPDMKIVYDEIYNQWIKEDSHRFLLNISKVNVMQAWIDARAIEKLEEVSRKRFPSTIVIVNDPDKSDNVPVILTNNKSTEPFEVITKLYGTPQYKGLDPTAYLAPFFILFFGLCLADVGYGLMMMLPAFIIMKVFKNKLDKLIFKSVKLLFYMGISSTVLGALTGNWFGNILQKLPPSLSFINVVADKFTLLRPSEERGALIFLGGSLLLGFIQIWFGVFLRFIEKLREKDYKSVIFDEVPSILIQTSLLPLVMYYVLNVTFIPKMLIHIFLVLLVISMVLVSYYHWKSNDDISIKIFWCLYGNYSIITGNFLSDTLSYARLFALGLSSGLLALAINEIAMIFSSIPYVGFVFVIIVFIIGHVFNLAVSFIGSFVHSCRLQYLEFFSKFFESGGDEFMAFAEERKYTMYEG